MFDKGQEVTRTTKHNIHSESMVLCLRGERGGLSSGEIVSQARLRLPIRLGVGGRGVWSKMHHQSVVHCQQIKIIITKSTAYKCRTHTPYIISRVDLLLLEVF